MSSNWVIMPLKQPKIFVVQKTQLITVQKPDGSRNFTRAEKILRIRQGQIDQTSEPTLKVIEANTVCSTQIVSGKFDISLSTVVHHLLNLNKSIQSYQIVTFICKL